MNGDTFAPFDRLNRRSDVRTVRESEVTGNRTHHVFQRHTGVSNSGWAENHFSADSVTPLAECPWSDIYFESDE